MNIDSLRQKIQSQFIEVEAGGDVWRIGKLLAADYLSLLPKMSAVTCEPAGEGMVACYVDLLSKTLYDENSKAFDSDEGRLLLSQLDGHTIMMLGRATLEFNTVADAKKN